MSAVKARREVFAFLQQFKNVYEDLEKVADVERLVAEKEKRCEELDHQAANIAATLATADAAAARKVAHAETHAAELVAGAEARAAAIVAETAATISAAESKFQSMKAEADGVLAGVRAEVTSTRSELDAVSKQVREANDQLVLAQAALADAESRRAGVEAEIARLRKLFANG
jgi:chromosome segregation ATPase